jgi:hypothetical protein
MLYIANKVIMKQAYPTNLFCTKRIKCWGGTNARSISTSATTIFLASFLKPSKAADAIAITL